MVICFPLGIIVGIFLLLRSPTALDVVNGDPAEDADRLLLELGALILDLQTRGTMAYAHWGIAPPGGAPSGDGVTVGERR